MDNYKIAIFHGDNPVDKNHGFQDGEIEKFGERTSDAYHILEFIDKIHEKYKDVPLLCGVKPTYPGHIPACFFTLLGDPVFYNTTPNDKKYGNMGQFYFSKSITEKQKESILNFAQTIPRYQIYLFYDIEIINGEATWKTKMNFNDKTNFDFLNEFFNQNLLEIKENKNQKSL